MSELERSICVWPLGGRLFKASPAFLFLLSDYVHTRRHGWLPQWRRPSTRRWWTDKEAEYAKKTTNSSDLLATMVATMNQTVVTLVENIFSMENTFKRIHVDTVSPTNAKILHVAMNSAMMPLEMSHLIQKIQTFCFRLLNVLNKSWCHQTTHGRLRTPRKASQLRLWRRRKDHWGHNYQTGGICQQLNPSNKSAILRLVVLVAASTTSLAIMTKMGSLF